jgi:hypothetical protein
MRLSLGRAPPDLQSGATDVDTEAEMPRIGWTITALILVALLAIPSAGAAKGAGKSSDKVAAGACAKERKQIGRAAFTKKYGERRGMRVCIRRSRGKVKAAVTQATTACEQELAVLGWLGFVDLYGSDETGADAFAECVADEVDATLDPAAEDVAEDEVDDEGEF